MEAMEHKRVVWAIESIGIFAKYMLFGAIAIVCFLDLHDNVYTIIGLTSYFVYCGATIIKFGLIMYFKSREP
jgi:hypothetical protein